MKSKAFIMATMLKLLSRRPSNPQEEQADAAAVREKEEEEEEDKAIEMKTNKQNKKEHPLIQD